MTQVDTNIYFLEITFVLNFLTGGYKRSIATDYQENHFWSTAKNERRKWPKDYNQSLLVHATKLQEITCKPVIKPSPYLNEFQFPGKDESTKLKYCAVLLV